MKNKIENVKAENVESKNVIDALLDTIESIDTQAIIELSKQNDTELVRSSIAKLIIETAHKLNELKSVKSVSTMRELLYNLIAIDCNKSKEFHKENDAKQVDTIKDIKASENAKLVFSSLYKKKYAEVVK